MSRRTRSISWMKGKILELLSTSYQIDVRNLEEQHNWDIALAHLMSRKQITTEKDHDGFIFYKLAA